LAKDLDELMNSAHNIGILTEEDQRTIRLVIDLWDKEPQAVSNILQHPHILPEDILYSTLVKALQEQIQLYFVLSGAVGVQERKFTEEQEVKIVELLFKNVSKYRGPVANRAFTSLESFLKHPLYTAKVSALLDHVDETLKHCARAWLIRNLEKESKEEIVQYLSQASEKSVSAFFVTLEEHMEQIKQSGWSSLDSSLLSFIPNFSNFVP